MVYLPMYYAATIYDAVKIVNGGNSEIIIDELMGKDDHFTCINHNTNKNLTRIGNLYYCNICVTKEGKTLEEYKYDVRRILLDSLIEDLKVNEESK